MTTFWGKAGAGVLILARDTGRVLFNHRSAFVNEPGTWGVWGGAIEAGEDPPDAALRELHEETGYDGEILSFEPLYAFHSGRFSYWTYLAIVPEEFRPILDWESKDYAWTALHKAPHPRHFGLQAILSDSKIVQEFQRLAATTPLVQPRIENPVDSPPPPQVMRQARRMLDAAETPQTGSSPPSRLNSERLRSGGSAKRFSTNHVSARASARSPSALRSQPSASFNSRRTSCTFPFASRIVRSRSLLGPSDRNSDGATERIALREIERAQAPPLLYQPCRPLLRAGYGHGFTGRARMVSAIDAASAAPSRPPH